MSEENTPAKAPEPPTPLEMELGNAPGAGLTLEQIRSVVDTVAARVNVRIRGTHMLIHHDQPFLSDVKTRFFGDTRVRMNSRRHDY